VPCTPFGSLLLCPRTNVHTRETPKQRERHVFGVIVSKRCAQRKLYRAPPPRFLSVSLSTGRQHTANVIVTGLCATRPFFRFGYSAYSFDQGRRGNVPREQEDFKKKKKTDAHVRHRRRTTKWNLTSSVHNTPITIITRSRVHCTGVVVEYYIRTRITFESRPRARAALRRPAVTRRRDRPRTHRGHVEHLTRGPVSTTIPVVDYDATGVHGSTHRVRVYIVKRVGYRKTRNRPADGRVMFV
jgi:hypothetical protein